MVAVEVMRNCQIYLKTELRGFPNEWTWDIKKRGVKDDSKAFDLNH